MITKKILLLAFCFIVIWIWNKYIPEHIVKSVGNFHRKFNKNNLDKQPIKFALENEENFIKFAKAFYWLGYLIISYGVLRAETVG